MKKILVMILLSTSFLFVNAQEEEEEEPRKGFQKENLFFGGTIGLSFGDYTMINVSPQVGYFFNKYLAAGAGINFIYSSYKYYYTNPAFDYTEQYGVAGLNIFGRVYPIQYILLQVQPELNYNWGKIKFNDGSAEQRLDPKFIPSLLLGGGAAIPLGGGRSAMTVMLQYDVIQDERTPYGKKAFVTVGFNF